MDEDHDHEHHDLPEGLPQPGQEYAIIRDGDDKFSPTVVHNLTILELHDDGAFVHIDRVEVSDGHAWVPASDFHNLMRIP
jgi:hypothetical protein